MTVLDWEVISNYEETVGTSSKTFTFQKPQSLIKVTNKGRANIAYTYRDWETDRKSTRLNSSHRL